MKKIILILMCTLSLLLVACDNVENDGDVDLESESQLPQTTSDIDEGQLDKLDKLDKSVSVSQLVLHNTKTDCWIVFEGEVYDVTNFLPSHPDGGDSIAKFCGQVDGFEISFTKQHGNGKVPVLYNQGVFQGTLE